MSAAPLVSVCIITFNHERYIRECIESVLGQRTDFDFEIIAGDDASTDATVSIIEHIAAGSARRIRVIRHDPKVGGTANMLSVHNAASGEFVAHLDGDDVMLPGKLQVQVDFLRAHARHVIVAHDMEIIDENSAPVGPNFGIGGEPPSADLSELVTRGCYFAHSSKMYRRNAASIRERDRETVDFLFHIDQARHGLVGYLNQPLGRYRRTQSGLSSINSRFKQSVLQGHLDAYDFALARGVPEAVVYPAKLNFRYVNAMGCLRANRADLFRQLRIPDGQERRWATWRQRLVLGLPARLALVVARVFDRWSGRGIGDF